MKRSTRILLLLVVVEALIIGGAAFSIWQIRSGAWNAGTQPAEVIKAISTVVGGFIPLFAAMMLAIYAIARRGEK